MITGAIFGMQVYGIACGIKGTGGPKWLLALLMATNMTIGLFFGTVLRTNFFMLTTSYLGSYMVFRGFGNLFGNYPNLFSLTKQVKLSNSFYMYVGLIVTHTLLGFLAQTILKRRFNDGEEEKNYKDKYFAGEAKNQPLNEEDQNNNNTKTSSDIEAQAIEDARFDIIVQEANKTDSNS